MRVTATAWGMPTGLSGTSLRALEFAPELPRNDLSH